MKKFLLERAKKNEAMDNLNAQIALYTPYTDNEQLNKLIDSELNSAFYSFEAMDGCKHEMWIITKKIKLKKLVIYLIQLEFILLMVITEWKLY